MSDEPASVTLLVIKILEKLQIPYLIGGSFASTTYGHVRTTRDVDIVAKLEPRHVSALIQAVDSDFYADEIMIRQAIERNASFNLIHLETMFKVDVFIPKARPFDEQQLSRRLERVIDKESGRKAYFASAEDTILAKLEWFRMGGEVSERQWRDIQGVIQLQKGNLDMAYLRKWAAALQVSDLLEKAIREAEQ
jgi:hypothetical protein